MNVLEMQSIQAALKKAAPIQNNVPSMRATTDNTPLISPISNRFSPIQAIKLALELGARKNYLEKGISPSGSSNQTPTSTYTAPRNTYTTPNEMTNSASSAPLQVAPMPASSNPWAGKSIEQIRSQEYARNPKMQPLEAAVGANTGATNGSTGNAESNLPPNVMTYLKDYVQQMRNAGYPDFQIKQKLLETGSIQIPNELPDNFGQNKWATGMANDFRQSAIKNDNSQQSLKDWTPSPNEYTNYQPGNMANRLPSYSEATGQDQSPFYGTDSKYSQTKSANLMSSLQNYMNNYQGSKVPFSQSMAEAGMVGLPQDLANSWIPEYASIKNQNTANSTAATKQQATYQDATLKYPDIQFLPTDTVEQMASKISQYNQYDKVNTEETAQARKIMDYYRQNPDSNFDDMVAAISSGAKMKDVMSIPEFPSLGITPNDLSAIYQLYGVSPQ